MLENDNTPVLFLIPPPPLHCVVLGPGNLIWEALEEICNEIFDSFLYLMDSDLFEEQIKVVDKNFNEVNPLTKFQRRLCILKEPYHGKVFNGKQLNKIFKNTDMLVQEFSLPDNLIPFITCLENLQLLNQGVSGVVLDNNYKELIENF